MKSFRYSLCKPAVAQRLRTILLHTCCFAAITTGAMAQVQNTSVGTGALSNNISGSYNSAFGYETLFSNTAGSSNSALGAQVLVDNTSGSFNSAFGHLSLLSNTLGSNNSAFGYQSLVSNSTGTNNNAFGFFALNGNTIGTNNNAFGYGALANSALGNNNAAFGHNALAGNTIGDGNVGVGYQTLYNSDSGSYNSALGYNALYNNNTGDCNVGIGYGAGPTTGELDNTIAIGCNAAVSTSNTVVIGNSAITSIGGFANWTNLSDGRFKSNVQENVPGIEFIKKLRPVTYNYDLHAYDKWMGRDETTMSECYPAARDVKETIVYTGFIAQEVEKAANDLHFDFSGVDKPRNDKTAYGLRYAEFVVPMVKAMQEQQMVIEAQQQKIYEQETAAREQQRITAAMEKRLEHLESLLLSQGKTGSGAVETGDNTLLNVYPNPTDGLVKISLNNESRQIVNLQLADITGKVLITRTASDATINMTFDLSGYPVGNYMLTVTQGTQTMSKVIVFGGK